MEVKNRIVKLLRSVNRPGMENLIEHMEKNGFFDSPCSGSYHLAYEGGLAEHSLNVCDLAISLLHTFYITPYTEYWSDSVIISALLHDLGKMGQFGKPNYVPNMLKGRATKANPNPEPYQSDKKPFVTNPELIPVEHEIRSIQIASQFIKLTEDESFAILNHNGMYSVLKYSYAGKETALSMIIHWADMWAARILEVENNQIEEEGYFE